MLSEIKSIKDIGKCTRSNKINGNFGKNAREQTMCKSYRLLQHVGNMGLNINIRLNPFKLNPPAQKVYITHNEAMKIENLEYISVRQIIITHTP